jgi:cyanophycin synthetase
MRIEEIKLINGPNQWDDREDQLVVATVDLGKYSGMTTHKIDGLLERVKTAFTGDFELMDQGELDNYYDKISSGISVPELIGRTAAMIQSAVELRSSFIKEKQIGETLHVIIISCKEDEAGSYAMETAIDMVRSVIDNIGFNLETDIRKLERIRDYWYIGLSTGSVVAELAKRGIPHMREKDDAFIIFGYGAKQERIQATISGRTSFIGVDLAGDKDTTKFLLREAGIPVPEGIIVYDQDELNSAIKTLGFPVVIKPLDGNHGRGISINIRTMGEAFEAFDIAQNISTAVIIERYIQGFDYRMLVVNYKFVAALKRTRAYIKGDGKSTVEELIANINREPRRQKKPGNILTPVKLDNVTMNILRKQGLTLESVLEKDEILYVKDTANVSTGGIPTDVTDTVHPHNVFQAERIAKLLGLDICGVDLISPNISIPFHENRSAVVEVNAAPGIRMHMEPAEGRSINVAGIIGDMLFPEGENGMIPVIAVSGAFEKTATVKLLSDVLNNSSRITGYSSSEGLCINNICFKAGKHTSYNDQRFILKDPTVELAILEINEADVLNKGLPFRRSAMSIITSYPSQTKGANYKDVVTPLPDLLESIVMREGDLIFNADDEKLKYLASQSGVRTSVYSHDVSNPIIKTITRKGGFAAVVERDEIKLLTERDSIHIAYLKDDWNKDTIPDHLLPAVLASFLMKADPGLIAKQIGCEVKEKPRGKEKETTGRTKETGSTTSRRSKGL